MYAGAVGRSVYYFCDARMKSVLKTNRHAVAEEMSRLFTIEPIISASFTSENVADLNFH